MVSLSSNMKPDTPNQITINTINNVTSETKEIEESGSTSKISEEVFDYSLQSI